MDAQLEAGVELGGQRPRTGEKDGGQQQGGERRRADRLEARGRELAQEVGSRVASAMAAPVVHRAPQERMLGHGQQETTPRPQRFAHGPEDGLVLVDVFQHVEGSQDVEFLDIGNVPGVHLEQRNAWSKPHRRVTERFEKGVGGHGLETGETLAYLAENESGSAADLQQSLRTGEVLPQPPLDESAAAPEPEVSRLGLENGAVRVGRIGAVAVGQRRREEKNALVPIGLVAAARAGPALLREGVGAGEAALQSASATASPMPVRP